MDYLGRLGGVECLLRRMGGCGLFLRARSMLGWWKLLSMVSCGLASCRYCLVPRGVFFWVEGWWPLTLRLCFGLRFEVVFWVVFWVVLSGCVFEVARGVFNDRDGGRKCQLLQAINTSYLAERSEFYICAKCWQLYPTRQEVLNLVFSKL